MVSIIINFVPHVGSLNLGDYIIHESINNILNSIFRKDNVFIVEIASHQPINYKEHVRLLRLINSPEIHVVKLVSGANPLSFHYSPISRLNQWAIGSPIEIKYLKGTILFGVGTQFYEESNNNTNIIKRVAKHFLKAYGKVFWTNILNRDIPHAVRDTYALEILNSMGVNAVNLGCPTLWPHNLPDTRRIARHKADIVVTTVTHYLKDKNDLVMLRILLQNYEKVVIWPQDPFDIFYLNKLIPKLPSNLHKKISVLSPSLKIYDKFLSNTDCDYIGTRVHGGIRALQHGRRTLLISVDHRARMFSKNFGLPSLDREETETSLESLINSRIKVNLKIPITQINKYLTNFRKYVLDGS